MMQFLSDIGADSVIFDLDGTLWDATYTSARTWVEVKNRHQDFKSAISLDRDTICKYMGLTCEEISSVIFPHLSFKDAMALMDESCELENLWLPECGGILFPSERETLEKLKSDGLRLFIVSNAQDGYVEAYLTAHKMWDIFDGFESSGHTGLCKGENIRLVMERYGLKASVYVGDTDGDMQGAEIAGIPFIYAKYGFGETFGLKKAPHFDAAIRTFGELA